MIPLIIAADYPIYPQRIGGMDRFFWELDVALKQTGIAPVWVFPESTSTAHYRERGIDLRLLNRTSLAEGLCSIIAREGGAQLLVTHFLSYNTRYPSKWKRAGVQQLLAVDHMSRPAKPRPMWYRVRYLLKGLITLKYVDCVIAVSGFVRSSIKSELGGWWQRKTKVVWNGVVSPTQGSITPVDELSQGEFRICFIGHLIPEKGVHVVIESMAGIVDAGVCVRFTIGGDGPAMVPLVELATRRDLVDHVDFIGSTARQMELMQEHDMVVIPSLWGEACGLVVLEAMMTGACILASRIGGIPEMLGPDGGVTVTAGDVGAWQASIIALMGDPRRRSVLRSNARRRAFKHFTLARMVQEHIREIDNLRSNCNIKR